MGYISHIELPDGTTYDIQDNQPAVLDIPNTPAPIATFSGASNLPLSSLKVAVTPYQDLHGYDAPWVGGAGKNKLPLNVSEIKSFNGGADSWTNNSKEISGIVYTILTDSDENVIGIKANGTATADSILYLLSTTAPPIQLDGQSVIISMAGFSKRAYKDNSWHDIPESAVTLNGDLVLMWGRIDNGVQVNNIVIQPMIRLASVADATFAPYSNICPISGWDEAVVTRCGKNLFDKTATDTNKGFISGKWINQTGNTFSYGEWNVSEYIRVDGEKIAVSGMTVAAQVSSGRGGYCCYDKYKNVLGGGIYNALTQIITLPTNTEYIRISVWNENKDVCQLELSETATTYEPYNGATYTIDLDGTRYGGTLDVTSGVLTVDRASVDLGTLNWTYYANYFNGAFGTTLDDMLQNTADSICSIYESVSGSLGTYDKAIYTKNNGNQIYVRDTSYGTDASAFKTAMNGVQLVYELETPITVQLSPTQVKSLEGVNNINANCGQITEGKYVVSKYNDMTAKISEFADKANQLTTDAGSNLNPVYFNNGVPVASIGNSIPFVVGTGTTAGTWLGTVEGLTAYYDGLLILYKPSVAGASTTTLNLNNLGAKTCYANGSTKLTTHYPANQPILLTYSASTNSGCFVALDNYWSSNTIGEYAGACKAGTNGMARYSLIMQTKQSGNNETWESLVTTSSTATSKTKNSSGFIVGSPVLYQSAGTYAKNGVAGTSGCWSTAYNVDTRYSCNVSSSWSAEGRPFFIKGTINTLDGLFYLADTTWWSDAYPTSADGFYYIYVGQMNDAYRLSLYPENPIFYYDGGLKVLINGSVTNAQTVNGHTVEKNVPSNAVFTDTTYSAGTALSLSGTTFNHKNIGAEGTAGTSSATHGATLAVPYIKTNAQGHVTGKGTHTHTVTGIQHNTSNISRVILYDDGQVSVQTKGYLSCNNYTNTGFKPMTASAFNVSSSRKVKENIEPITDEEAYKLLDVTPVSFDYISEIGGAKNQFGVIAEEVNDILPFVVSIPEDYKEDDGNYMNVPSVDYSKFIPHLIKLVQIQEQKINELQQEIFELKNK